MPPIKTPLPPDRYNQIMLPTKSYLSSVTTLVSGSGKNEFRRYYELEVITFAIPFGATCAKHFSFQGAISSVYVSYMSSETANMTVLYSLWSPLEERPNKQAFQHVKGRGVLVYQLGQILE